MQTNIEQEKAVFVPSISFMPSKGHTWETFRHSDSWEHTEAAGRDSTEEF